MTVRKQGQHSTAEVLRNLSVQDFQNFGTEFMAYIKPVEIENRKAYAVYAADGRLLSLQDSGDLAIMVARHNGLEPVIVH